MKPNKRARTAAAITLSKGKMYEYGVPEEDHLVLPPNFDLEMQFPLAIGSIGDFASEYVSFALDPLASRKTSSDEILFAARVLQAFDESRLRAQLAPLLRLLSAAAFYLGDAPGNAIVQIGKLEAESLGSDQLAAAAKAVLSKPWTDDFRVVHFALAAPLLEYLNSHFMSGAISVEGRSHVSELRAWAYSAGTAHELLMADLVGAIVSCRISRSAWSLLPRYSGLSPHLWGPYLSRPDSLKELWPSQRMVGEAGLYRGESGIVQMPTSAGKSRAIELIVRSSFLSGRTKLALIIAPFRALCQEIAADLEKAFSRDGYDINQVSDALQSGHFGGDLFEEEFDLKPRILILTPEKFLYMLRQDSTFVEEIGLIVYDEGHQFDTGSRGVTYELLLTSIKRLLPSNSQSVLISAVIENAGAVARWLLADESRVISDRSMRAPRLIGFASLPTGKDGQIQFNAASVSEQRFFVPRVIVREKQTRIGKEKKDRFFPTEESGSVALYLALRLVQNGGVAIYAGKKNSAAKIVRDAVEETFRRGISLPAPVTFSDSNEIARFVRLYKENFGADSYLTSAALLGIFAHHGSTPFGVRLAIEYAMRQRMIHLVVCTSTLAQGVNLPIRYLLVTSAMQGREQVKARDFHNLMGRAGRAGMYGEGTVIFTNHKLYDERRTATNRWERAMGLIDLESAEPTGSTLLSLLDPLRNEAGTETIDKPSPSEFAIAIIEDWTDLIEKIRRVSKALQSKGFTVATLVDQLMAKKRITDAVESFLMTHRTESDAQLFIGNARTLAGETLAYSLASDDQRNLLEEIFEAAAKKIERLVPEAVDQLRFGRSLLGIREVLQIDDWVRAKLISLEHAESEEELFSELWPLLTSLTSEKFFTKSDPKESMKVLADGWLAGHSFDRLLKDLDALEATYAYGESRRKFDIDIVVDICEQAMGFEFGLHLAAIRESYVALAPADSAEAFANLADSLQKRLKYGLPDQTCTSLFEAGFSDRVVAQKLSESLMFETAKNRSEVRQLIRANQSDFVDVLTEYPSYFSEAFRALGG